MSENTVNFRNSSVKLRKRQECKKSKIIIVTVIILLAVGAIAVSVVIPLLKGKNK